MNYTDAIQRLNERQLHAVERVYGATMVIAGAGTGKTQMLAARVAHLMLSEAQVDANNILCLTFSEAGAAAMRERVVEMVGVDGHRVVVKTFHGFCHDIVQSNLSYFKVRNAEPVTDLDSVTILRELIDSLPVGHPIRRLGSDAYFEVRRLKALFQLMKEEAWSPADVQKAAQEYIDILPYRDEFVYKRKYKEFNAGDLKQDKIDTEKRKMELLVAAAGLIDAYNDAIKARGKYDYADMIQWVLKAFTKDDEFLRNYQERHLYVLVDESQDTSGGQFGLVYQLLSFWDDPNIFIVGDDDQGIYEFQGARIWNLTEFARLHKPDVVVLTDNYRSTQPILDAANQLIRHNSVRLVNHIDGLEKNLISKVSSTGVPVKVYEFNNRSHEGAMVLRQIQRWIGEEKYPDYNNIAIIYRKHSSGEEIAAALEGANIPVTMRKRIDALSNPKVQQVLDILRAADPLCDSDTFDALTKQMLLYPVFGVSNTQAVKGILTGKGVAIDKIRSLVLIDIRKQLTMLPVFAVVAKLCDRIANSSDIDGVVALRTFLDWVRSEFAANPSIGISQLWTKIQAMSDEEISLQAIEASTDVGGITLTTAHGAKGLEWDKVIIMGAVRSEWEASRARSSTYFIPDTLTRTLDSGREESERRLMYVAMTRARKELVITYAKMDNAGKALERSRFIDEAGLSPIPVGEEISKGARDAMELYLRKSIYGLGTLPSLSKKYMDEWKSKYRLSPTHLEQYLKCPHAFYTRYILRVPEAPSEALIFGDAIHATMEAIYRNGRDGKFDIKMARDTFHSYMSSRRGSLSAEAFERRSQLGGWLLYEYQTSWPSKNKVVLNEYTVNTLIGDVPVKFIADKLEFMGNDVTIVDYKTGSQKGVEDKLVPPSDKYPEGGTYWRQLAFEFLGLRNIQNKPWRPVGCTIESLSDKGIKNFPVTYTAEELAYVTSIIKSVYSKIMAGDFSIRCRDEHCFACKNLLKWGI